ncbi:protein trichome birefringence-like 2 [Dendrobium catenatum]|nr:protein trichome birefringence-like 2 [Dendrobium catenatum]XP_020699065.1 protein trichome birefringence-like 2 [Dendrobium catenatum]XP_028552694.1 protein trichome birefringence-like 2 [Dendrobium catenatum]
MDPWKHLFLDHNILAIISSKRRVLSGFVLGIAASIIVVYLLASINTSGAFPRFPFPRSNDSVSASYLGNSSSLSFSSLTGENGTVTVSANRASITTTLEGNFSQPQSDLGTEEAHQWSHVNSLSSKLDEIKKPLSDNISKNATDGLGVGRSNVTTRLNGDFRVKIESLQNFSVRKSDDSDVSVEAIGGDSQVKCDIFDGGWVRDLTKPYYPPGSCPYIDIDFDCYKNGRPDDEFLRWRWKPYGCDIPSLNATDFLERLKGKRILFVGDSLNRNMWESLICILHNSIKDRSRVYEVSGRSKFKIQGYYSFRFEDYMCSVDFVRSPFLVKELLLKNANGSENERLRLDLLDETMAAYHLADIVVFNTGHWWTHEKTSSGINYYQEGNHVYPVLDVMKAYKKALTTWSEWVDRYLDSSKTQVVFRGYSVTHFRGGQWNSGGQCHKEIEPIFNDTFITKYPKKMIALEGVLRKMETPVLYLNISRLTDYRKDGHPSIYRKKYNSEEELREAEKSQDCSHWCLPGVPDTWNELLYASLLMEGKGPWRK